MTDLAELLANGLRILLTYTEPETNAVHRVELIVQPATPGSAPGETAAAPQEPEPSPGTVPAVPDGWADRPTFQQQVRGLYDRVQALDQAGRQVAAAYLRERGYDLKTMTRTAFLEVSSEVARLEAGRSADPATGEHNDAHEPTDDHDHGSEELDAGLAAQIGYAVHPETDDHWHPEAHSVTDDWQADPNTGPSRPPDEVPF